MKVYNDAYNKDLAAIILFDDGDGWLVHDLAEDGDGNYIHPVTFDEAVALYKSATRFVIRTTQSDLTPAGFVATDEYVSVACAAVVEGEVTPVFFELELPEPDEVEEVVDELGGGD